MWVRLVGITYFELANILLKNFFLSKKRTQWIVQLIYFILEFSCCSKSFSPRFYIVSNNFWFKSLEWTSLFTTKANKNQLKIWRREYSRISWNFVNRGFLLFILMLLRRVNFLYYNSILSWTNELVCFIKRHPSLLSISRV